jgi:hypothetical protein
MDRAFFVCFLLVGGLGFVGCSKEDDTSLAPMSPPSAPTVNVQGTGPDANTAPPPVAPPTAPGAPAPASSEPAVPNNAAVSAGGNNVLMGVDRDYVPHLISLNTAYQAYMGIHMRPPESLEELIKANQGVNVMPPVPPGKKYQLDNVKQCVIVVPK